MKKIIIGLIVLLVLIVLGAVVYVASDSKVTSDEKNFKKEYESLNGQKNDYNKTYPSVSIREDNNVKYASYDEVIKFLDEGTGILFLGFPECPWCRNMISTLVDTAVENEVDDVYYFNALPIRDVKELDENGEIKTTKKGTNEYYKLVDKLKDFLGPYKGLNDESIKRIYFPTVVFVQGGKIVGVHIGTVDSQEDPYKLLDKKQLKELKKIYTDNINKIYGVCDDSC